jgi:hypothetical protein
MTAGRHINYLLGRYNLFQYLQKRIPVDLLVGTRFSRLLQLCKGSVDKGAHSMNNDIMIVNLLLKALGLHHITHNPVDVIIFGMFITRTLSEYFLHAYLESEVT